MRLKVELEQEDDGRWIAEVEAVRGAIAYGATPEAAIAAVKSLVLRAFADRLEHGESLLTGQPEASDRFLDVLFETDAA